MDWKRVRYREPEVAMTTGLMKLLSDSETFDLAGKSAATIEQVSRDAFGTPWSLPETVRITLVTGAGKLARQKYDEGAAKAVTGTLRTLGYKDDASGSPGTYKQQHDTGKNLKTVVVYPKVVPLAAGAGQLSIDDGPAESLIPEDSPEYKIAHSSLSVFQRMVDSKCSTWSQKKALVTAIDGIKDTVQTLDGKLLKGTPLTDSEQDFYDAVSVQSLDDKQAHVRECMHKHVDDGNLTAAEKRQLLDQVGDRIATLTKDIAKESKPKVFERLKNQKTKAEQRKEKISGISPKAPSRLRREADIVKLHKELSPLLEMEAAAKGRLLSVKETQSMARKEEIEQEIADLEEASREWFESDDAFDARVAATRSVAAAASKKTVKKKAAPSTTAATKWVTPTTKKASAWKTTKPKNKPKGGNVFAAMMDSDSD